MKTNRFIENFEEIKKTSREKNVDVGIAVDMYIVENEMTDYSAEKKAFNDAYILWYKADFKGEIADYLGE